MDNKIKLSKIQAQVIQRLQSGERLHYLNGINARCFFGVEKNVSWATIQKLEDLKLIDRKDRYVELTETGKNIKL